jgi:hypothetical protein
MEKNTRQASAAALLRHRAAKIKDDADAQANELLRIANNLDSEWASPIGTASPPSASSRIRNHQFRGMTRSVALEVYMRERRDDGRIPIANVVLDLLAGGLELGPHRDRWERHIMAVARERPRVFCYDPVMRELWLASTADQPPQPKIRGKGRKMDLARKAS